MGQILGVLNALLGLFILSSRTRKGILTKKLITDIFAAIQQTMIGAHTGGLINAIAIGREFVFFHRDKHKWASHKFWLWFFVTIIGLSPLLTWAGPKSLLPMAGSIVAVFAFYNRNPHTIRKLGIVTHLLWLIYTIIVLNIGGIMTNVIQIFAAIYGLIIDHIELRKDKNHQY